MKKLIPSASSLLRRCFLFGLLITDLLNGEIARGQNADGTFTLVPSSAPNLVLEAVKAGTSDGTPVALAAPSTGPEQKWTFVAKGDNSYVIRPGYSSTLVLATSGDAKTNGAAVVLKTENDQPAQLWSLKKNENGSFSLLPQNAPAKALDNPGGNQTPGTVEDLWDRDPDDTHTQWTLKALDGAKLPVLASFPEGTIKPFTFAESTIYPGTTRTGTVYIPAQYDGSTAACVYVQQDGYRSQDREMLAQLIANKEMPVVIGVFVHPGDLPVPPGSVAGTSGRRNRDYEYDGVSDRYARFLSEELLPYIAKEFNLKLSTSGNDRCLVGASSGGIAAFNAAWLRPEDFSRVYSCSGSFSAFRGGYELPTKIRKFEARPIRAYLTAGTYDMENCAGPWYLFNQEMDSALKFSGYDYSFHVVNGGHGAGYDQNFPDAMRFIWKGWPAPVTAGPSAPRVRDIITDEKWSLALKDYLDARSPVSNSKGEIFFVDEPANKIYRLGLDGKASVFLANAAHANGLAVGPKDELYTVSRATGKIMSYDAAAQGRLVVSGLPGQYAVARPDGSLYVTAAEARPGKGSEVWLVKGGKKTVVDTGLKSATGLAYRPDQWLLAVADGASKWVYSYGIGSDGTLNAKEPFFDLLVSEWDDDAGPESVCYAQENRIVVGTRAGVQICADDGPTQIVLPMPDHSRVTGVALGGPQQDTLFAFCGDKVWKRTVKIHASAPSPRRSR